jgi:hypothetical protein
MNLTSFVAATFTTVSRSADAVALNPQPLPPKTAASKISQPGGWVTINPQPLPPRDVFASVKASLPGLHGGQVGNGSERAIIIVGGKIR